MNPSNIETPGGPLYPPPRYQAPRHGLHIWGIALGVFGSVFGLIPILGIVAFPCGVLAVLFGWMSYRAGRSVKVRQGRAAMILGVLAIVLGVIGLVIVNDAINELDEDINQGATTATTEHHERETATTTQRVSTDTTLSNSAFLLVTWCMGWEITWDTAQLGTMDAHEVVSEQVAELERATQQASSDSVILNAALQALEARGRLDAQAYTDQLRIINQRCPEILADAGMEPWASENGL